MIGVRGRNAATRSAVVPVSRECDYGFGSESIGGSGGVERDDGIYLRVFGLPLSMIAIRRFLSIALSRKRSAIFDTRAMNLTAATG